MDVDKQTETDPDKTEFLLTGNQVKRSKYLSMFLIELLGVKTYPATSAFGVIFDKNFNFRSHISAICNSQLIALRGMFPSQFFKVRPSLPSVEKAHTQ